MTLCDNCNHDLIAHGVHSKDRKIIDYACAICDCTIPIFEQTEEFDSNSNAKEVKH